MVTCFILPDYPSTTKWLSEEERAFAAWRLLEDINEKDGYDGKSVWDGCKMALKDYRMYVFVLMQHISLLSQTFQYFFPSIVGTLGYGKIVTLWLTAPVWVCVISDLAAIGPLLTLPQFATFLVSVCVTWSSAKTEDRSFHIIGLMIMSSIGNAIATATTSVGPRFFAMFLMPMGAVSACKFLATHTRKIKNFKLTSLSRSNHRFMGRQLLHPSPSQAFSRYCHSKYDR